MEESKRKKKNKKNKGKTTSTAGDAVRASGAQDEKRDTASESNNQEPDKIIAQSVSVSESEGDLEKLKIEESKIVVLEEIIKDLRATVVSCIDREVSLEKKIEILQGESDSFGKKELSWNLKLEDLQREMSSWITKEVNLDERLKNIENDKESRVLEKAMSEMLTRLEEIDAGLQVQVRESEMAKDNLVKENRELTNKISLLEARIQHLENESAAASLTSPAIIATKVNITKASLPFQATQQDFSTSDEIPIPTMSSSLILEKEILELPLESPSPAFTFETININSYITGEQQPLDGQNHISEIVPISLDDDDQGETPQQLIQEVKVNDTEAIPLSDAPLIGAPFRLISFFAKYVSGADLVREDGPN